MLEPFFKNFAHLNEFTGAGLMTFFDALRHAQFCEPVGEISTQAKAENARTYTIKTVP